MGDGDLKLAAADGVTTIAFADSSGKTWGAGSLVITGAQDNEVSVGTSSWNS